MTFGALGDPTRRSILTLLARGPLSVNAITASFDLTQQAISKHLACLERASLIRKRKVGRQQFCQFRSEPLERATSWADHCRAEWESRFDKLEQVLETMKKEKRNE